MLFCTADDAALCSSCDHRLHHHQQPDLLSSNHHRFPLLYPNNNNNNNSHFPLCDICQERRAFLFCQEDRAILCKDCDVAIHWANQVTRNHQRFLLTGVKLSSAAFSLSSLPNSNSHHVGANVSSTPVSDSPSVAESSTATASAAHGYGSMNGMAEYLIEPLPEWHFEEFIDSSSTPTTAPHHHHLAFSKAFCACSYVCMST
ncbi:B-box zinc finger protein 21-like isoform X3 [Cucumis melo var. makuwa]|uniref:B-box zinc finger protein 21-like isoform X3 n=1 Tax=Cucumis melo var. makuwa TaxID=1194695 RepID=A0A5A7SK63_CUCMM|nr:B-box zinc finger protein 21-like isoform X3 [Cucumis melo var. makuwa]TYK06977.1 B-box zinc finger protein 21-like isoform X3 [Cucumis melo var. makuwa]